MRRGHRATTLSDGNIFYSGGKWRYVEQDGQTINEQIWLLALTLNAETLEFSAPVILRDLRAYHSATLLADGRVLLAEELVTQLPHPRSETPMTRATIQSRRRCV